MFCRLILLLNGLVRFLLTLERMLLLVQKNSELIFKFCVCKKANHTPLGMVGLIIINTS